jgi:hypothetical protein
MNYFMIGGDKQEYGPVNADHIKQWIREGRANGDTLLRAENESEWRPLRTFADFQSQTPPGPPPLPTFVSPTAQATTEIPEPNDVPVLVGHAFARAWHLVAEHFGTIASASLLVWLMFTALMYVSCFGLLPMLFAGPLFGGLYMLFLKLIREGEASPGDMFTLTRDTAMPLMMTSFFSLLLVQVGALLCCLLPGIYLLIAWLFSIPLVADRRLGFWDAMELSRRTANRHWFKLFGLCIIAFLPFIVFSSYMYAHQVQDMMPYAQKMAAALNDMISTGSINYPQLQKIMEEQATAVQGRYISWAILRHVLLLVSIPFGVGSLAFVYEDLFGRKK